MDIKIIAEILVILIVGFRIYILESMQVNSVADKMFSLYYLKNHYPLLGYFIIFYIVEIILLELALFNIVDIALIFFVMIDIFVVYRHFFISLKTDDKDVYIDTIIKSMFSTLTLSEFNQIKNEFTKPQPKWKLYLNEMMVVLFAVWSIELGV